nr:hypothetical protein [Leuven Nodavirus-like 1]
MMGIFAMNFLGKYWNVPECTYPLLSESVEAGIEICTSVGKTITWKHCTIVCGVIATAGAVRGAVYFIPSRALLSKLCFLTKRNVNNQFRLAFNTNFRVSESRDRGSAHSHPISARNRTDVERSMDTFIYSMGLIPYSVSMSARDDFGQRLLYGAKDLDLAYKNDRITDSHVLRMIDVDYYADMNYWLWFGRPVLIYTFVPESVGGPVIEGTFNIQDNVVSVVYNGGGVYQHQLWDYNVDHFIVKGTIWNLMVKVDQVKIAADNQRRVILLTPTTWYLRVMDFILDNPKQLSRRRFKYGDANIANFNKTENGVTKGMVSIGTNGTPATATIEHRTFAGMCLRMNQSKHPCVSDVERYLRGDNVPDAPMIAPILFSAYLGGWANVKYTDVDKMVDCGVAQAPHYQVIGPLLHEEGEDIGVEVWKPLITGAAVFPKRSFNNDAQAIKGRVKDVKNEVTPGGIYYQYMREFIAAFPNAVAHPTSYEYIEEQQTRPAQKARHDKHRSWIKRAKCSVQSFMKKEAYGKITDPRNISTVPASHTMMLSTYIYAIKEYLKEQPWYTPALGPKDIASRVMSLVQNHTSVMSCDYSRLDGTISGFLRNVERGVFCRMMKPKYRDELRGLMRDEISCPAATSSGLKYDPGNSRLSGSPLTTDGNTVIVGFVAYCAARFDKLIQPGEINKIPGLVYGDDKLMVGVRPQTLETVAKALGLTLKCKVSQICQPVEFLARIFVDPWTTPSSVQNPLRSLGKMHLSVVRDVDKRVVAHNKARGYIVGDRLTPLISDYCNHILVNTQDVTDVHLRHLSLNRENVWWVDNWGESNAWPQELEDQELFYNVVAESLSISVDEVRRLQAAIAKGDWTPLDFQLEATVHAELTLDGDTRIVGPAKRSLSAVSI